MNFLHTYLLLVGATYCCTATLTVDLELILYNNPQHRDCAGIICDSASDCDNFFDFCVRAAGNETCLSPMLRTDDLENDLITFSADDLTDLGITNPIQFSSISTNSLLEFFVKITDDDGSGTDDEIDEIIIPLGAYLQANSEFGPNVTYYGACGRAYIQVQTRITSECPTNRYGPDCTNVCEEVPGRKVCNYLGDPSCLENYYYPEGTCETYCKPRNDVSGHYDCSEKGEIMCLDGYIDPSTNCITCRGNFKEPDCNECDDHFEGSECSFCELNYYPTGDCSVMCIPQNNSDGHYTCDPFTGNRVCLEGYRDPSNGCVTPAEEEEEEEESSTIVGSTGFYVLVSLGGLFLTVVLITLILVVAGLCRQRRLKYYSGGSAQRESDTQPIVMEGFPQNEYPTDDVETKE